MDDLEYVHILCEASQCTDKALALKTEQPRPTIVIFYTVERCEMAYVGIYLACYLLPTGVQSRQWNSLTPMLG